MELGEHAVFATHVVRALDRGAERRPPQHVLPTRRAYEVGEIGVPGRELLDGDLGSIGDLLDVPPQVSRHLLDVELLTGAYRAGSIEEPLQG